MRLTKFTQSCIRLDDADRSLVIDPGIFSDPEVALAGADAVLITHEDADHADVEALRTAAKANPGMQIWAPASVAGELADLGDQVVTARSGESFEAAGFSIETFGGQHGLIHSSIPVVENVAYLIDSSIYHPGDSFVVPPKPIETLLVPIDAPWSKMAEVMDFVASVRAPQAFQMHEYLMSDFGLKFIEKHVAEFGAQYGTEFTHLDSSQSLNV